MSYYEECLEQFKKLPEEVRNKIGSIEVVKEINKLETEYEIELGFLIVLVVIGEIKINDIPDYLEKKFGLDFEEGLLIKEELIDKVFIFALDEKKKSSLAPEGQIKNIFEGQLSGVIRGNGDVKGINEKILLILSVSNELSQEDLVKMLFTNQEKLTSKEFILDGKKQEPTISNWLKDFIKNNGGSIFDNLTLSQYLAKSENAKKIDVEEKRLLHKLLILYRNLKFFPESMGKTPTEEWEIVPLDDEEKPVRKNIKIGGEDERVVELRNLLEQYEPGSIERRAIEEELRKLNHEL